MAIEADHPSLLLCTFKMMNFCVHSSLLSDRLVAAVLLPSLEPGLKHRWKGSVKGQPLHKNTLLIIL